MFSKIIHKLRTWFDPKEVKQESKSLPPESEEQKRIRMYKWQRENAVLYTAQMEGRTALGKDNPGTAVYDTARCLKRYGYDPGWLDPMVADTIIKMMSVSSESEQKTMLARSFVEGFHPDEEAAKKWLETHSLDEPDFPGNI